MHVDPSCLYPLRPVILLPGWRNAAPEHWLSRWERLHGDHRVDQNDWEWPRRGDWMSRLEETLLGLAADADKAAAPALLVADGLGCHLVSAWAAHSACTGRVAAALLVAPCDVHSRDLPPQLASWRTAPQGRLPFPSRVVASHAEVGGPLTRMREMAAAWGSELTVLAMPQHFAGASKSGEWPEGRVLLRSLAASGR